MSDDEEPTAAGKSAGRKINLDEFEDSEDEIRPGAAASPSPSEQNRSSAGEQGSEAEEDDEDEDQPSRQPATDGEEAQADSDEGGQDDIRHVKIAKDDGCEPLGDGAQLLQSNRTLAIRLAPYSASTINEEQEEAETASVVRWRAKSIAARTKGASSKTHPSECVSNTRIVTWEDGSQTLHVGADVFFMQKAPVAPTRPMFVFRRRMEVQTCQGEVASKVKLQPASRRKIRSSVSALGRAAKPQRVEFTDTLANPEKEEMEALSKAAERERLANKREAMKRRQEQRRMEAASGGRARDLSRYMEDEEDEYEGTDYEDEEDRTPQRSRADEFEELTRRRRNRENPDRLLTAKNVDSDSEGARPGRPKKRMRRVLSEDESSDEEDE